MARKPPGAPSEPRNRFSKCLLIQGMLAWLEAGIWSPLGQKPEVLALLTLASMSLTLELRET